MVATESMIERVARAVYADECDFPANAEVWPFDTPQIKARMMKKARAAIEAMREPTEAMSDAWRRDADLWIAEGYADPDHPWKIMIDVALEEPR